MMETNSYSQEFLQLHSIIKNLQKSYINQSTFLIAFVSYDNRKKKNFIKLLIENAIEGYIKYSSSEKQLNDLKSIVKKEDKFKKHILDIEKMKKYKETTVNYFIEFFLEKKSKNECVIYLNFENKLFKEFTKSLSQPEIISGINLNNVTRKVKNKPNLVAFIIGGSNDENEIYIQSAQEIKNNIYDLLVNYGDIYNKGYQELSLIPSGLLWGVPPLPDIEQAQRKIEYLKSVSGHYL